MRARLTLLVPRLGFGALIAACFLVPTVFTRQAAEAFMVPKATVLWLCLIVALAGMATWSMAARRWPLPPLAVRWPLLVLVAWTAVATIASTAPWTSLIGQYGRYDGLMGTVAGAAALLLVVGYTWRAPDRLRTLALAIIASGVVGLGYVAIQDFGLDWIDWLNESLQPIERPYGLLGNSNFSGAHLAICIPLALAFAQREQRRWPRLAWWMLAAAFALGIWWTGTRGGMLATVAGIAVAGLLDPTFAPRAVRWGAIGLAALGLVLILAASTGDTVAARNDASGPRVLQRNTLADRQEIWRAGLAMARAHPLVGVGPDTFGLAFPLYRATPSPNEPVLGADEAHDIFIDRLATAGLPAAAAYLWLIGVVGVTAWRGRRRLAPEHRWLLAGFAGALSAYLVQGAFSIDVVPLALLGWVSIGAVSSLTDPRALDRRDDPDRVPITLRPVPLSAFAVVASTALLVASVAIKPLTADIHFRNGLKAVSDQRPSADAATQFAEASRWMDSEPRYHTRAADQLVAIATREVRNPNTKIDLLQEALLGYRAALDRGPGDAYVLRAEARVHGLLADLDAAHRDQHRRESIARYRLLTRRTPTDTDVRVEYALALETFANGTSGDEAEQLRHQAGRQFRTVVDLAPRNTAALSGLARIALVSGRIDDALTLLHRAARIHPGDTGIQRALAQVEALRRGAN